MGYMNIENARKWSNIQLQNTMSNSLKHKPKPFSVAFSIALIFVPPNCQRFSDLNCYQVSFVII